MLEVVPLAAATASPLAGPTAGAWGVRVVRPWVTEKTAGAGVMSSPAGAGGDGDGEDDCRGAAMAEGCTGLAAGSRAGARPSCCSVLVEESCPNVVSSTGARSGGRVRSAGFAAGGAGWMPGGVVGDVAGEETFVVGPVPLVCAPKSDAGAEGRLGEGCI